MDEQSAKRVDKPWGHELIWAHTERYVGKLLVIEPGKRLSLQYHEKKDESVLVIRGTLRLHIGPSLEEVEQIDLKPGQSFRIPTGYTHRFEALAEQVELVEVSTPELDDVVRVEDDFGRKGTSAP